jgi:hypothetical protein
MTDTELKKILVECLSADVLNQRGQILYSGIDTLRPGKFYFIGFNPKRDGTNPILCNEQLDRKDWSAYTRQCWTHPHQDCPPGCRKIGNADLQKRVQGIMSELGLRAEMTFATNLIFVESQDTKEIKADPFFETYLESCWRVHRKMLAEIRPKFVVCLGNGKTDSAFSFLLKKASRIEDYREEFTAGNDAKYRKRFVGSLQDIATDFRPTLIGVRHPARPMSAEGLRAFIGC